MGAFNTKDIQHFSTTDVQVAKASGVTFLHQQHVALKFRQFLNTDNNIILTEKFALYNFMNLFLSVFVSFLGKQILYFLHFKLLIITNPRLNLIIWFFQYHHPPGLSLTVQKSIFKSDTAETLNRPSRKRDKHKAKHMEDGIDFQVLTVDVQDTKQCKSNEVEVEEKSDHVKPIQKSFLCTWDISTVTSVALLPLKSELIRYGLGWQLRDMALGVWGLGWRDKSGFFPGKCIIDILLYIMSILR